MHKEENTAFGAYRAQLAGRKPLSRERERELANASLSGDRRATDELVGACLPFVIAIALEYRRWGVPLEDIVQQGNLGLLKAVKKFDTKRECRLATYGAYWIRAEIREYVVRACRVVRFGTTKAERRALRIFRRTQERDPQKLAEASGLALDRVEQLLPLLERKETSLSATSSDGGLDLEERLSDNAPGPEENAAANEAVANIARNVTAALDVLSERERMIVTERLLRDDPVTLEGLGIRLGVSKERVRQLEERARQKLRARLETFHRAA
jgi:RNA polymerase sigma-32 factor